MEDIFITNVLLHNLHTDVTFSRKIEQIHTSLKQIFGFIHRISVILYDPPTETLKTFIHSSTDDPISTYETAIYNAPSLDRLKQLKTPRLVNDLSLFSNGEHTHTQKIATHGYQASYTVPMFDGDTFLGVTFFNSRDRHVFKPDQLPALNIFAQLINCLIISKLTAIRTMVGSFKSVLNLVSYKDPETGNHLERMARYARLIARHLAKSGAHPLSDEIIEHIYLFAPLHDIGKIGIPDRILLKPGRLNSAEWQIMQTHAAKGGDIIDTISEQMGLQSFEHISLLRNISQSHHETIDGKGYPRQLKNDEIPIETQIVSVADIFDALTSERTYKKAWTIDDAFDELKRLAGVKINAQCVDALIRERDAVEKIQQAFQD